MSDFRVIDGAVWMIGEHRPCRLSDWQCEQLLDVFEDAEAADLFNRLYEAQRKAMGELHMPRVSSLRGLSLVVNNSPREAVRDMLKASVSLLEPDAQS